jgi:hypothetical protein
MTQTSDPTKREQNENHHQQDSNEKATVRDSTLRSIHSLENNALPKVAARTQSREESRIEIRMVRGRAERSGLFFVWLKWAAHFFCQRGKANTPLAPSMFLAHVPVLCRNSKLE